MRGLKVENIPEDSTDSLIPPTEEEEEKEDDNGKSLRT